VDCGGKRSIGPFRSYGGVRTDQFVAASLNKDGTAFTYVTAMDKIAAVPMSAWIGDTAVTAGGKTYAVSAQLLCYNSASQRWITLEQARDYSGSCNLYLYNDIVRLIEVE
jgi:hypothetical protein